MEIPPEVFTIGVPAAIGVSVVALTVLLVFWLGVGRQRSFEEAKAQASRRAEKLIRAEQHNSRKEKKKKQPYFKKRREEQEDHLEPPSPDHPPRPILKPMGPKGPIPERSLHKVGFQLEKTPPRDEEHSPRPPNSPPTPYPTAAAKSKLFESPPTKELVVEEATRPQEPKPLLPVEPKPKPVAAQKASPPAQGSPKPSGQRKIRQKTRQSSDMFDKDEGLPASRISDILGASSLSDEDIQQLIQELFEKMNANAEWQAAARPESIKSLKKYNQDLQSRVEEAERTVVAHSSKIKELRSEIQQERSRRQVMENTLQSKLAQHANDQQVARTKISGLEEELKQTKALSTAHALQQLREEYSILQHQMATLAQQNSGLNSQLLAATKQVGELQDNTTTLKGELRRAKEALKSPQDSRQLMEKVKELEGENMELQRAMQASDKESSWARAEMKALGAVRQERDSLAQKARDLEQQLQAAHEQVGVRESVGELAAENASLLTEIRSLREQGQRADESQVQELQAKQRKDMAALRTQLEAAHDEAAHIDSQREEELQRMQEMVSRLEEASREAGELRVQLQREQERASVLDSQLVEVNARMDSEQAGKKALQLELESLKTAPVPEHAPNGPLQENGSSEEKLPSMSLEVHREVVEEKEREKEELTSQLKALEKKLDDLKTKNNILRDNCWRAKDEAATASKECEQKLKQVYKEAEGRCKAAKAEALTEAQDSQMTFLQRLFPNICVEAEHFATWVDEFESKALDTLQHSKNELTRLQGRVEELEKNESTIVQEAEQLRTALQTTMGILSRLQSDVEDHNAKHQKTIEEREQMLERERTTNRSLQEQLRTEKNTTAQLQEELRGLEQSDINEKKIEELEQRLQDSEHQQDSAHEETETLRHSLQHEQDLKIAVQHELDQLKERQCELKARVKMEVGEKEELSRKSEKLQEEIQQLQSQLKGGGVCLEQQLQTSNGDPSAGIDVTIPAGSTEV